MKSKRRVPGILAKSVLTLATVPFFCVLVEQVLEVRDKAIATANDTFVTLDDRRVRYRLLGADNSGPPIVLLTGGTASIEQWADVQTRLAARQRVLAYDRGGAGFSDFTKAHDANGMADELAALLSALDLEQESIIVSYSSSAFMARVFAARYSRLTKALVHIDPATRDNRSVVAPYDVIGYWDDMGPHSTRIALGSLLGYRRLSDYLRLRGIPPASAAESRLRRINVRSRHWIQTTLDCWFLDESARQAEASTLPASIPVSVLSTYSPAGDAMTFAQQQELVRTDRDTFVAIKGVWHGDLLNERGHRQVIDLIMHAVESTDPEDKVATTAGSLH